MPPKKTGKKKPTERNDDEATGRVIRELERQIEQTQEELDKKLKALAQRTAKELGTLRRVTVRTLYFLHHAMRARTLVLFLEMPGVKVESQDVRDLAEIIRDELVEMKKLFEEMELDPTDEATRYYESALGLVLAVCADKGVTHQVALPVVFDVLGKDLAEEVVSKRDILELFGDEALRSWQALLK